MKKYLMPMVLAVLFVYAFSQWVGVAPHETISYNSLYIANLVSLVGLLIASLYAVYIKSKGRTPVDIEQEDEGRVMLERASYSMAMWLQIPFSVSFVALTGGFIVARDSNPKLVLYAMILCAVSFFAQAVTVHLYRYVNPEYKLPDPQSPTYQQELFDSFDDGEKYLMLKSFYKLYYTLLFLIVLLCFALMYYSVFSGNSQLISIIGLGAILLFMQIYHASNLKPKKY
ncbi:DUF3169 family protein [Lysinibacillus sp. KU-BSD001]|uniref:DUF3169 family protein n=1 Tax=Lysinibacillus sp. KU-BSD001 TaxID=3141328 RepID=UPI0036E0B3DD